MKRWMSGLVAAGALTMGLSALAAVPAGAATVDLGVGDAVNVSGSVGLPSIINNLPSMVSLPMVDLSGITDLSSTVSAAVGDLASVNFGL